MARPSAVGAPATPELTEESEERSSTGAGAMATSNASSNALERDSASKNTMTTNTGAMGQNESRDAVRTRNDAIRRAGQHALVPRPGKLPRRSGAPSHGVSGQRRLGTNVLADANTYDVPSDDEPAPIKRQAATTAQFSPLKRQILQQSREQKRRHEEQTALDQQLLEWERESQRVVEDIENRRKESEAELLGEDAAGDEMSELGSSGFQPNVDAEEPELSTDALDEPITEPLQPSTNVKRRGRPRKSREGDEEQEVASDQRRRKRGRPSNAEKAAEALRLAAVEKAAIRERPLGMSDGLDGPTGPPQVTRSAAARNQRPSRSLQTAAAESNDSPPAPSNRLRQLSADQVVAQNSPNRRHQAAVTDEDESLFVEDIVRLEEVGGMNDEEDNDPTHVENEPPAGEGDGAAEGSTDYEASEDDDDNEHVDETEIQLEPMASDRHRLYGHWHKIRDIMREVSKHRGSTVRIKDDEFIEILQACKEAKTTVSAATADISPDALSQTVAQCEDAIAQAKGICGDGEALTDSKETRKRCFHIFKHLLPILAKLLRAAIKAFERVDRVGSDTDQIPLEHLSKILELLFAVVRCGECAYRSYPAPSRPIKKDVHGGITIHLHELHSSLSTIYSTEVRRRDEQKRNEELAREIAARDEERERQLNQRKLELRNQEKWKRMNKARFDVSKNSGNIRKQNHLRSCGMQVVKTDRDGQPYLPINLREKRGEWSMLEIEALEASLRRHVDTPAPLDSMVFERLIAEQCPFRRPLTDKNVLEIVIKSNELKNFYIQWSRDHGSPIAEWVKKIPRWMDPPRSEHDNGSSAEDAIEIE